MRTHNIKRARYAQSGDAVSVIATLMDDSKVRTHVGSDVQGGMVAYLAEGGTIDPAPAPPPPTADQVRAEAQRRLMELVGARSPEHLATTISNASREAVRLLRLGSANWTEAQATRAAELEAADAAVEVIRAASNALESNPPADYADDKHWRP